MYVQTDNRAPSSQSSAARPTRAALQTRPRVQRTFIRSWEYSQPIRVTILAIRMLVVLWLFVLCSLLVSAGSAWAWALPPAAVAVFAVSLWVFSTAAKGWPAVEA